VVCLEMLFVVSYDIIVTPSRNWILFVYIE
jgi:hypothetical protein